MPLSIQVTINKTSSLRPDKKGEISYAYCEDMLSHQVLRHIKTMQIPILLIVGSKDDSTPPIHQQYLFELWNGPKTYKEIKDCEHTFKTEEELSALKEILDDWIDSLDL